MGEQAISAVDTTDEQQLRAFMRAILDDLQALEQMIDLGMIESGVRRVGAEQEMFIVDRTGSPAPLAMELLAELPSDTFTTELARFNLEANLQPRLFEGDCLSSLHQELLQVVAMARAAAARRGADILLTGILPTIRLEDLGIEAMCPKPRYKLLNDTMLRLKGGEFRTMIKGLDELQVSHDNILLEACNTSFQVHFQVGPQEFAKLYNLAQAVTAPVLAAAVNSPTLLQHRLWRETRIALFQQSVDARSAAHQARGARTRVRFGERWVQDSIMEIYREDVARFRVVLARGIEEDPLAVVARGEAPPLTALRLHNGTIYRWNRPCYGVIDGKAHLRIESRAFPSGPSVTDEVANGAFFFGLMSQLLDEYGPIDQLLNFDDVNGNFTAAARLGLQAQLTWVGGQSYKATDLILDTLLPLARAGLARKQIRSEDIDRYLGVIEARCTNLQTGAAWALNSLSHMGGKGTVEQRYRTIALGMLERQKQDTPVHSWDVADVDEESDWRASYRTVGQYMITDLFTVGPKEHVDLAASVMTWEHIRHVPVENDEGQLVGLVTYRDLLHLLASRPRGGDQAVSVETIMKQEVKTATPQTPTVEAIRMLRESGVGCLPVVDADGKLVGMVTEDELLRVASVLLEAELGRLPGRREGSP
jgi:CBS domain-containing protein